MIRGWITVELVNGSVIKYVRDLLVDSSGGALQSISIYSGGTGYVRADINKTFVINSSIGKGAITNVSDAGAITEIALLEPGSGYSNATNVATSGGTGSGLTINTTIVPDTGQIATLTKVSSGTSTYQANDILIVNSSSGSSMGGRIKVLSVTGGPPGTVNTFSVLSSGSGYRVGDFLTTLDTTTAAGSGATFTVASINSGIGIPRQYYAYDGITHTFDTETGLAGQIKNDYASIISSVTGANKYITFPDNYVAVPANTLPVLNSNQPLQRGLYDYSYVLTAQVCRIVVQQEWYDASGTGILNPYNDTTFMGTDIPTGQIFS